MRSKASPIGLLALTVAFLVLAFSASSADAEFGIKSWEALTCKEDKTITAEPCLGTEEAKLFTQAAAHPNFGITDFKMNQKGGFPNFPDGSAKDVRVDLPVGLGVNPQATPQCTVAQLTTKTCPAESIVGTDFIRTISPGPSPPLPPPGTEFTLPTPVYNVETPPNEGEPFFGASSMAGFNATGEPTILVGATDPKDQHISFTISDLNPKVPLIGSRLVFNGRAGDGFLTMPSECDGPQRTLLNITSFPYPEPENPEDPELLASAFYDTTVGATGCDKVPFEPKIAVSIDSATDSPEPVTADLQIPYKKGEPEGITNSELHVAKVTLPEGMGINPSSANGLVPCTNAQFAKDTNDPITCPDASKIGTIEVETPSLPPGSVSGTVYVGQPLSNNPSSGEQFRIFMHVFSKRFGVNVRLVGNVFPNLQTGQVTAVVDENPQAPFSSFKVHINGGVKGTLTTPDTCGPHTTTTDLTPYSGAGNATPSGNFTLTSAPDGGPCPKTLAERPFGPTYSAGTQQSKAGAFSPFVFHLTRPDGAQEIRQVNVNLPPGMVAKLKGIPYCPQSAIDAATAASGAAELASPSCPSNSLVGTSQIAAGSGPAPFHTTGKAYLAGPYKGAPLSMVFVTPAVAGPYDLGTVVVRVAINIDPETAEVHAVSDPIPYIVGGVKLDLRSIDVSINRSKFTLNPTTCRRAFPVASDIFGGGGDPANPASWFESKQSTPFQGTECGKLQFKPKFHARILGGKGHTQRADNPKFRAILEGRNGDANVRRAAFILPRATILDQGHIKTICTKVQLAANECPKNSIYGNAKATSPLLGKALKGPVYLTSSEHELPDLLVDLKGQINVRLRGIISSAHGRLKTEFPKTPDVAVTKFMLTMKGGSKGLLVNSRNLCTGKSPSGFLNLLAQNSRQQKSNNLRLNIPACGKH